MFDIIKELFLYFLSRKKYWLLPIILFLLIIGILFVVAKGSAVAPFIYTIF